MVTLTEITAIIGAVAGSVSLSIIFYKAVRDRPKLNFEIEDAHYFPPGKEEHNKDNTSFNISIRIDNKGDRSTAIHSLVLSFEYDGKTYYPRINSFQTIPLIPNNSEKQTLLFQLPSEEVLVETDIKNCKLVIGHTHGTKTIPLPDIRRILR